MIANDSINALPLLGCSPTPLAHYLKALGVLRLLSEQLPPEAPRPRGSWRGQSFVLHTHLDRAGLEHFFLQDYCPTPILAPWNGDGGFFPDSRRAGREALATIENSKAAQLEPYRSTIRITRQAIQSLGLLAKVESGVAKDQLLLACRNLWPNASTAWLDAAVVLTSEGSKYPPLLGSGGNDGSLEFTNNLMQRLAELFDSETGEPTELSRELLVGSLFGEPVRGLANTTIGQYFPDAAGGANSTSGFDAKASVNAWDFVFAFEGTLLFAAAAVKRLESGTAAELAFPFSVRPSGSGYATAGDADSSSENARCEFWVPLWSAPASLLELRALMGEGRAQLRDRAARDGFEFSRAIVRLGVDRGLSAFQRYSFQRRNGRSFFATPLDRIAVRRRRRVSELLDDLDRNDWVDRVRRAARGDRVPNRVRSAVRQLEAAALALCRSSQVDADESAAVEALLLTVADAEEAVGRSLRWTREKGVSPLPSLSTNWWWALKSRGTAREFDLAASLAGLRAPMLRVHWEPLNVEKPFAVWDDLSREVIWNDAQLVSTLIDVHVRRLLLAEDEDATFRSSRLAHPQSIAAFLDGETDDIRLARLARALSLVRFPDRPEDGEEPKSLSFGIKELPALFALPRLALAGFGPDTNEVMPRVAAILRRGASGDGKAATELAAQRLRASGFTPALSKVPSHGEAARRAIAATLFPLSSRALSALADQFRPLQASA